jgi:hypothetical protein
MKYAERYHQLQSVFNQEAVIVEVPGSSIRIANFTFHSRGQRFLPGEDSYSCATHGLEFVAPPQTEDPDQPVLNAEGLAVPDARFGSNQTFRYSLFLPEGTGRAKGMIFLLHGLNERYWVKYLPWAMKLVELTGKAVCLFPIAFHMNRAPIEWSRPRRMAAVSAARTEMFPSIEASSFANAAISARLHSIPQRFFWSGVQTYDDVLELVHLIRRGDHPLLDRSCNIDFFGYSVGSFLSEILLMANEGGVLEDSKLFIFCGGPTFDRMYPVSRYILDSEALIAIYAFFVEHLNSECRRDKRLDHYFNGGHPAGFYFKTMLSHRSLRMERETRFDALKHQIRALALRNDEVIQPSEVMNTLQGGFRDIPIRVDVLDFPTQYSHVTPFPMQSAVAIEVERSFEEVFGRAAEHLGG